MKKLGSNSKRGQHGETDEKETQPVPVVCQLLDMGYSLIYWRIRY